LEGLHLSEALDVPVFFLKASVSARWGNTEYFRPWEALVSS